MAKNWVPYDFSHLRQKLVGDRNPLASRPATWWRTPRARLSPVASVLGISAYFLLLGSVAVIVITEQFPWFIVAPATVLLTIGYFRHVEATEARRSHRGA